MAQLLAAPVLEEPPEAEPLEVEGADVVVEAAGVALGLTGLLSVVLVLGAELSLELSVFLEPPLLL